jgi:quinol monooxygenase YgiN
MYGRIETVCIKPGMEQEFLHSFRNQGVPTMMALGCVQVDVFLDSWNKHALVTTLWPTRESAETAPRSAQWQELRARLAETLESESSVRIMYRAFTG